MAYHSPLTCDRDFGSCNMAWMPLKNPKGIKSAAPQLNDEERDIIDDVIFYFRPNVFYASYDIDNNVDRTYVYGTLYLAECLKKLARCKTKKDGQKELFNLAVQNVSREMPGDPTFPLKVYFTEPNNSKDKADLVAYLTQFRQEIGHRIVDLVFENDTDGPSKWWMMFNKFKFINKVLKGTVY